MAWQGQESGYGKVRLDLYWSGGGMTIVMVRFESGFVKVGLCRVELLLLKVLLMSHCHPNIIQHTFQIMSSMINLDEEVAETMKSLIETSMMTID
jgi:hypothetical protein